MSLNVDSLALAIVFAEVDTSKEDQLTVADLSIQAVGRIPSDLKVVFAAHKRSGNCFVRPKDVVVLISMSVLT